MSADEIILDASVFIRAVRGNEPALSWVRRAWGREVRLVAPALILAEVANGLLKYVERGEMVPDDAYGAVRDVQMLTKRVALEVLFPRALELALARGLTAYDAAYAHLAEVGQRPLVTADRRLAAAVPGSVLLP